MACPLSTCLVAITFTILFLHEHAAQRRQRHAYRRHLVGAELGQQRRQLPDRHLLGTLVVRQARIGQLQQVLAAVARVGRTTSALKK